MRQRPPPPRWRTSRAGKTPEIIFYRSSPPPTRCTFLGLLRSIFTRNSRSFLSMANNTAYVALAHCTHSRLFTQTRDGARARARRCFRVTPKKKRRSRAFKNVPFSTKLRCRVDPSSENVERQREKLAERRETRENDANEPVAITATKRLVNKPIEGRDREIPHHSLPAAPAPSPLYPLAPLPQSSFAPRSRPRYSAFKAAKHPPRMSLVSSTLVLTGAIAPSQLSRVT